MFVKHIELAPKTKMWGCFFIWQSTEVDWSLCLLFTLVNLGIIFDRLQAPSTTGLVLFRGCEMEIWAYKKQLLNSKSSCLAFESRGCVKQIEVGEMFQGAEHLQFC